MDKLLIICGPTATGKTSLALKFAKKLKGDLVSADSRQVYKRMNIGTGKDIPEKARWHQEEGGYWQTEEGVRIWGYDLVDPKMEFSVGQYAKLVRKFISDIRKRKRLPILVGGTGLYIKAIADGIPSAFIARNKSLRDSLSGKDAKELFELLTAIDPIKAASLNSSDRKNPRRLVRAYEISVYLKKNRHEIGWNLERNLSVNKLFIGLRLPISALRERIEKRIDKRIEAGLENEIKALFNFGVSWDKQSMAALGYGVWRCHFEGTCELTDVRRKWLRDEVNYAKRQMTWFKKDRRIRWIDVDRVHYFKRVEKMLLKWHNYKA